MAGNISIGAAGTLTLNRPDSFTYDSRLSGTGTLLKFGIGTLTMSGTNSFSGNLIVSMGMLDYSGNSTLPGGNYTVNGAALNCGTLNIGSLSHSIGSFQITGNGAVTGTGRSRATPLTTSKVERSHQPRGQLHCLD